MTKVQSSNAKFRVDAFDGKSNICLWQSSVKDLLAQQGLHKTLEKKKPTKIEEED